MEPCYHGDMKHMHDSGNSGHVVVGVDGSENSKRAFDFALSIAQQHEREVKIVAAFTEPGYEYIPADVYGIARKQAEHVLEEFTARAEGTGVQVSSVASEGDAAGVLIEASDIASLVVVGKRGRSRFAGRFLGSVSASVAAHSRCPSLIVPAKYDARDLPEAQYAKMPDSPGWAETGVITAEGIEDATDFRDSVVVGIDVDAQPVETALHGARYAQDHGLKLILVAAEPLSGSMWIPVSPIYRAEIPDMRREVASQLEAVTVDVASQTDALVEWRFYDADPADVLAEASQTAAFVVVGTRGRGGFTGLLLGSISQAVLNRAVAPVLVVPSPDKD